MASSSPKILTKKLILDHVDNPVELVDVPQWGGSVFVRGMTGVERDRFEREMLSLHRAGRKSSIEIDLESTFANARARLVARCTVDEDGNRLFEDSDIEDLGRKSATALQTVYEVAQRLSGLTMKDMAELSGDVKTPFAEASSTSVSPSGLPTHESSSSS